LKITHRVKRFPSAAASNLELSTEDLCPSAARGLLCCRQWQSVQMGQERSLSVNIFPVFALQKENDQLFIVDLVANTIITNTNAVLMV
jgi:hypothetical protein